MSAITKKTSGKSKVLLLLPELPQHLGSPYLGQLYVAANLAKHGHDVQCIDLAANKFRGSDAAVVTAAERFAPDMIGMTLFTYNARAGYELAAKLRHCTRLLVAGGPHPTVVPREPLRFGFDIAVSGEGEHSVLALLEYLGGKRSLETIHGVWFDTGRGPERQLIDDLDALAFPYHAYACYNLEAYAGSVPGDLVTSRGCPAKCTFCANYVTGRSFRWRSAQNVVAEMRDLRERFGVAHFSFLDDAFTARRSRLNQLCDAIIADPALRGVTWSCITPGNMVNRQDIARMRNAGCVAINFGIESGDRGILGSIHKGQRPEHVQDAVMAASQEQMITTVNFMFGFPGEGVAELNNSMALMEALAPHTDFFNNRGVLVPMPGTPVYERWHTHYGFTDWWLDPAMIKKEPDLHNMDQTAVQAWLAQDPSLDLDFFRYSDELHDRIAECVRFKAAHNRHTLTQYSSRAVHTA